MQIDRYDSFDLASQPRPEECITPLAAWAGWAEFPRRRILRSLEMLRVLDHRTEELLREAEQLTVFEVTRTTAVDMETDTTDRGAVAARRQVSKRRLATSSPSSKPKKTAPSTTSVALCDNSSPSEPEAGGASTMTMSAEQRRTRFVEIAVTVRRLCYAKKAHSRNLQQWTRGLMRSLANWRQSGSVARAESASPQR